MSVVDLSDESSSETSSCSQVIDIDRLKGSYRSTNTLFFLPVISL